MLLSLKILKLADRYLLNTLILLVSTLLISGNTLMNNKVNQQQKMLITLSALNPYLLPSDNRHRQLSFQRLHSVIIKDDVQERKCRIDLNKNRKLLVDDALDHDRGALD